MGDKERIYGVYNKSVLEKKVYLNIVEVGNNVKHVLEMKLKDVVEGKCISEGFVRPNSLRILNFSSGLIQGDKIEFVTVFECDICHPVEGQLIECTTKAIAKAGIHAVKTDNDVTSLHIFIAKDHHVQESSYFNEIKENMNIVVKVIGIRYELNDPHICIIAKLGKFTNENEDTGARKIKIKKSAK